MTTQTGDSKNNTFIFVTGDTKIDGQGGTDTLQFNQTDADLRTTTLVSVEILQANISSQATTFTVDQSDLIAKGSVLGNALNDTLMAAGASLDLRSTTLSSVEIIAGKLAATTFIVDQA